MHANGIPLPELQWLPSADEAGTLIGETDDDATGGVVEVLDGPLKSATALDKKTSAMLSGLSQASASRYEQALVTLGTLLGAESVKPPGQGRADAVWVWPQMWVTLEAKTEQTPEGAISIRSVPYVAVAALCCRLLACGLTLNRQWHHREGDSLLALNAKTF